MTLAGSLLGAWLLLVVPSKTMSLVIAAALIVVTIFSLTNHGAGLTAATVNPSSGAKAAGIACTFLLGIYGGFFSGGYVALLTSAFVAFFHFTFIEAVALTKVLNVFSSLVATVIFAREGLVNWRLGLLLGLASFAGGLLGAALAKRASNLWLRRIFVVPVIAMALKTLLLDVPWANL